MEEMQRERGGADRERDDDGEKNED
jgi:hypothetical protein